MVIKAFPPLDSADSNGLLAIGGDLDPDSLLLAYENGIFPWPLDDDLLAWFSPPRRAILEFDKLHIPRSLAKEIRRQPFTFSVNKAFSEVVEGCRSLQNRKVGQGTWINSDIVKAYHDLFERGCAFSIEVWNENKLVGGLYGVNISGFLGGESMFFRETNASKLAICYMVENFKKHGFSWLDCQVMTPHMKQFGAELISRKLFIKKLNSALEMRSKSINDIYS